MSRGPSLAEIVATRERIAPYVSETPTLSYFGSELSRRLAAGTRVWLKLELFQRTGSFKPRGAVNVMLHLSEEERRRGVTAVSAGNHAIATAYAGRALGVSAKVVMPRTAPAFRVERCRDEGAEVVLADSLEELFATAERLQAEEGRSFVHPFEGPHTFEGTATVGWELCRDAPELDAVIVPIGGGGLIAGIASAFRRLQPSCRVYGVEPVGAQGMTRSLAAGRPAAKVEVSTIADSLGAPLHTPLAFSLVQSLVDDVVLVDDDALVEAMRLTLCDLKLAVEPAGAAALAALTGPLRERLAGKRVALVVCGSNLDPETYCRLLG